VIATGRKIASYPFEVVGEEPLETAVGVLGTTHVRRIDADGDRVELWLDRAHDMLPVRIYSADHDGLVLDFVLRRVTAVAAN